jgi:hypothetical protein
LKGRREGPKNHIPSDGVICALCSYQSLLTAWLVILLEASDSYRSYYAFAFLHFHTHKSHNMVSFPTGSVFLVCVCVHCQCGMSISCFAASRQPNFHTFVRLGTSALRRLILLGSQRNSGGHSFRYCLLIFN